MLVELDQCPICKERNKFKKYISAKDNLLTKEDFTIVQCLNCKLIFTNPRPDNTSLGNYYKSSEYDSHKLSTFSLKDFLYHKVRAYSTHKKLNLINLLSKNKTLLDIGSGAGYFINYCFNSGWKVEGMEPNLDSFPSIDSSIKVHSSLSTLPENSYDIITMWHSLEHISDIDQVLITANKSLKRDGKLLIAVPNINSYDFNLYKENWAALDVPRHLYHFTQDSIRILLTRFNFKVVDTKPLIFDSYYVSLLSEKHKSGKMNYGTAFINGLKSNRWAKRNNKNYSSLLYIISKNDVPL